MQNITELRKSLADNYTKMKAGKMGLNTGKELSNCAGKILNSVKVQLEYNYMMGVKEKIEFMDVPEVQIAIENTNDVTPRLEQAHVTEIVRKK